jgi:hypothetical protein
VAHTGAGVVCPYTAGLANSSGAIKQSVREKFLPAM